MTTRRGRGGPFPSAGTLLPRAVLPQRDAQHDTPEPAPERLPATPPVQPAEPLSKPAAPQAPSSTTAKRRRGPVTSTQEQQDPTMQELQSQPPNFAMLPEPVPAPTNIVQAADTPASSSAPLDASGKGPSAMFDSGPFDVKIASATARMEVRLSAVESSPPAYS